MKINLHPNGWTVILEDVNLATSTTDELHKISELCATYTCVKIRNQKLTVEREVEIAKSFKNPYQLVVPGHVKFQQFSLDNEGFICRVTEDAIAGHKEEMLWHNEMPSVRIGSDIAWLYAERGVSGSVTVWNNTVVAYNELSKDICEQIKDLKCIYFGNVNHSIARTDENFNNRKIYDVTVPLVHTNHLGMTGLHLSLHQFERFEGMTREESLKIAEPLFNFITQDKYCYFHEWQDGDVSLSDQWLGVHKRLHFESMDTRLVHRATFNYMDLI
jgi:taurine dioxygenase/alpha-ketoglutarate-dependent 2,4-dichlorophenoxyacetate dioxygenase